MKPQLIACGLVVAVMSMAQAADPDQPMPTLPAQAAPLATPRPDETRVITEQEHTVDLRALSADLQAMAQAAERVRTALRQEKYPTLLDNSEVVAAPTRNELALRRPQGEPRVSSRLGSNDLKLQFFSDGSAEVSARITNERVKMVYGEMLHLLGYKMNDQEVASGNQRVDVHLEGVDWKSALTRLCAQASIGWMERAGDPPEVALYDLSGRPSPDRTLLEARAVEALRAAGSSRDNAIAAEAFLLGADRQRQLGRYRSAVVAYLDLIETFANQAEGNAEVRRWMHRALLGLAETFARVEQPAEARAQYLNYLSLADAKDPELPAIMLKAAEASRELGRTTGDVTAFSKAVDLCDNLIARFADTASASVYVAKARNLLGLIHYAREDYAAAKEQLMRFSAAMPESLGHQLRYILGRCDFALAEQARAQHRPDSSDLLLSSAETYFMEISDAWRRGGKDAGVDDLVYRDAFHYRGLCRVLRAQPDFVGGLYAFLEARRAFPQSALEGQVLVHIAHCYAELQNDERSIETLYDLLKKDDLGDGADELARLLAQVQGSLSEWPGPVRARVLYYIAQAYYRMATRDRLLRGRFEDAAKTYRRVLEEGPDRDLAVASRLGEARALLGADDPERAEAVLVELLRQSDVLGRDRAFAGQLLGRLYQERGELLRAVQAYRGEVPP